MSKCKICDTDYYNGDELDPEEPCWCREMNNQGYYDFRTFKIFVMLKICMFFHRIGELFVPEELKG